MFASFKFEKALQSAAYLLGRFGGQASYYSLLKMLYMADRAAIAERGNPITTDTHVAMDYGPTLSNTLSCIKTESPYDAEFQKFIQRDGYDAVLVSDPGRGSLSRWETRKLDDIFEKYKSYTFRQWVALTHDLPEFKKNAPLPKSSAYISIEDLIDAVGMGEHKEQILQEMQARDESDKILGE